MKDITIIVRATQGGTFVSHARSLKGVLLWTGAKTSSLEEAAKDAESRLATAGLTL